MASMKDSYVRMMSDDCALLRQECADGWQNHVVLNPYVDRSAGWSAEVKQRNLALLHADEQHRETFIRMWRWEHRNDDQYGSWTGVDPRECW